MKGRRLPDSVDGTLPVLEPGDYIKITGGLWFEERQRMHPGVPIWIGCAPSGHQCSLNHLHTYVEHEDGTLSVEPSILISRPNQDGSRGQELWHGYLRHGEWQGV